MPQVYPIALLFRGFNYSFQPERRQFFQMIGQDLAHEIAQIVGCGSFQIAIR